MRNKIYSDGYSNSGGSGYVLCDENGIVIAHYVSHKHLTNNEAEYEGVLRACQEIDNGGTIYTDSKLVEGQLMHLWKVNKKEIFNYVVRCKHLINSKNLRVVWVRRDANLAGVLIEQMDGFK